MSVARFVPGRHAGWASLVITGLYVAASCGGDSTTGPTGTEPPANTAPVAHAGADRTVTATLPVSLDGSASSDADGDAITYTWSLTVSPGGSGASLDDATSESPMFTPDVPGDYVAQLVVNDGEDDSSADQVTISAEDNTTAETIGATGGEIVSTDGAVTMEVPSGALAGDEEISITLMPPGQRPAGLDGLSDAAVVYRLEPDGLTFSTPVRVTLTLPSVTAEGEGDSTVSIAAGLIATLSDGTLQLAGGQVSEIDPTTGELVVSADISHFSSVLSDVVTVTDGELAGTELTVSGSIGIPAQVYVDDTFAVETLTEAFDLGASTPGITATMSDASTPPVQGQGAFPATLTQTDADHEALTATRDYLCSDVGAGAWGSEVDVTVANERLALAGLTFEGAESHFVVRVGRDVECVAPPISFSPISIQAPEAASRGGTLSGGLEFNWYGGFTEVVAADKNGGLVARFAAAADANQYFGAIGHPLDGLIAYSDNGLFGWSGDLPAESSATPPTFELMPLSQPSPGPDLSARATDAMTFGFEAEAAVAVMFGSKELAFFYRAAVLGGTPEWLFDTSLATAFDGTFADMSPVTAYVGDDGFDETHPMLVGAIAGDGSGTSKLYRVTLESGSAVKHEVTNLFPAPEVRKVRCLMGICAMSAYGSGIGFGSIDFFTWDGDATFTPITGRSWRTLGLDMGYDMTASKVLIATTGYSDNSYTIDEISPAGEFLTSSTYDVPAGCMNPGHVVFRDASLEEVLLTCNGSDNVVAAPVSPSF